jgi:hypothetical protein
LTRAQVIIIFDEIVNAVKVFDDLFPNLVKNILEKRLEVVANLAFLDKSYQNQ